MTRSQWHRTPTVTDIYKKRKKNGTSLYFCCCTCRTIKSPAELFLISHYKWLYIDVLNVTVSGVQAIISTVNHNMQLHVKIEAGRRVDGRSQEKKEIKGSII